MLPSKRTLLSAALAAAQSLSYVAAEAHTDDLVITPAPTPTQALAAPPGPLVIRNAILSTLTYDYTALPSQVYPFAVLRGPQFGYNQCGAANATATANCQTLVVNNASDFCIWGSPDPNGLIGDVEAKVVSYCTNPEWGGRPIPGGSIHGVQFMRTSAYIQIVGFLDNTALGLSPTDAEASSTPTVLISRETPSAASSTPSTPTSPPMAAKTPGQVHNWNLFVGNGLFCLKALLQQYHVPRLLREPLRPSSGATTTCPTRCKTGPTSIVRANLQTPVGTYVTNGQTSTWSMPDPLTTLSALQPRRPLEQPVHDVLLTAALANLGGGSSGASGSSVVPLLPARVPIRLAAAVARPRVARPARGANPSATGGSGALHSANLPTGSLLIVLGGFLAGAPDALLSTVSSSSPLLSLPVQRVVPQHRFLMRDCTAHGASTLSGSASPSLHGVWRAGPLRDGGVRTGEEAEWRGVSAAGSGGVGGCDSLSVVWILPTRRRSMFQLQSSDVKALAEHRT
ncbi:hypothetical protein B0H14DRAFT_3852941 [Mycena olivaceomarginata]|nr:hypothetical protein B0H14DRAFT_3852941 [Mycena olivaceomarginata]